MFDDKIVLITGGTGSLGNALTRKLLQTNVKTIRIFSRDELKQIQMESQLKDKRLRFFIGDVRDKDRLSRALEDVDIVIHAAALKHVPVAEYNPFEAVKTNVYGTQNLIDACLDKGIESALAIGTDKAVSPLNTYGATKLLMERMFISANYYKGNHKIKFFCVRYGNVLGSRGSVVPLFVDKIQSGKKITITDPTMTRFNITMNQALDLIFRALKHGSGGEVFVPKLKSYTVGDLKDVIMELMKSNTETEKMAVRPGEKYHECLINKDEIRNTFETNEDYVIFEDQTQNHSLNIPNIRKTNIVTEYASNTVELLNKDELKKILLTENLVPIKK
ncbi:MAG: SDR family NAD(P)-dependent oxidoreductase [Thaumarchaeota archaeon]|nr:SDR family NAD(P)-dependent oxidoreductase [Nitrososphaerota archaeon]